MIEHWTKTARRRFIDWWRTTSVRIQRRPTPVGSRMGRGYLVVDAALLTMLTSLHLGRIARVVAQSSRAVRVSDRLGSYEPDALHEFAASGVCLVVTGERHERADGGVADVVPVDVLDRERHAILLRRTVDRTERAGVLPTVSVLLATMRPGLLASAVGLIGAQQDVEAEIVLGLHGPRWEEWSDARIRALTDLPTTIVRLDQSHSLGAVLNAVSSRAQGVVISKWDDDDWYGSGHLSDLVSALDYSESTVVGKAAEFVYLESADVTLRRESRRSQRFSPRLAGGTLTMQRSALDDIGGWPDMRRWVDLGLLEAVGTHGGRTYRTHGMEYVLHRRAGGSSDHTWSAGDEFFLESAERQWQGRRTDVARV